ncbi:Predicted flavoprotein CzcO associated with the cation diffusion facilitator CzcD [Saccharopolyspora antimicrobica]|uniref:Cation diffusion facilitator CzcD-associated flavoprotein CzcO n=1 Tax=Saccharopolyspora antimicrobica TaxID=455193 RepID=A0A1I5IAH5_9PSEU|nr:NAD(P)/FAD-dependent oxidoreductase [Saccharopolyspora antimicrobica]RKT85566.1 cation diffusion facilitator CzcD-associated flavoprotein CzcO [Saccharopolyspora antimicrobica]SFO57625.1 Predicted flavoprotein CzcO associated with the cation diffusion facilitator CzcD [Saccharopolyspora antimicrobica]
MAQRQSKDQRSYRTSVVIVGTGFSGLGMAIKLKQAGIEDFIVLEKAADLGGTWRDNTYPGCACDVPSLMYSFSFEQNPNWSRMFARQGEISDYLQHCADKYRVRDHIHYGVEFSGAEYDEATQTWRVSTADGSEYVGKALVSGVGALHIPSYPELPGVQDFEGEVFHSAEWNHDFDLAGKRVAVIGTGASAIQFVPQIAKKVAKLHLFQRTPPWIQPKPDRPVPEALQRLFRRVPLVQRAARAALYWTLEARYFAVFNKHLGKLSEHLSKRYIRKAVKDPEVRAAVTPDYSMGCKRILLSSDYYPALNRSNVDLVTSGVAEVRKNSVVTGDGQEHPVDAIIYGTGFHVTDAFDHLTIVGRDGRKLQDAWRNGMEAYLGVAVSGFPNLFFLLGPNTGLGHNSVVFMIESQLNYVLGALRGICRGKVAQLDVRQSVQDDFNSEIQSELGDAVWSAGGCRSWYLDENGVNRTIWPGFTWKYWLRTRKVDPADFEITAARGR